jgi:hypothetical protein
MSNIIDKLIEHVIDAEAEDLRTINLMSGTG